MTMRRSVLGFVILLQACSSPPAPRRADPALPPGDLQPLAVGMSWDYVGALGDRHVHRVVGRETVGRFDCYVFEQQNGSDIRRLWMISDGRGLRHYRSQDGRSKPRDHDEPVVHFPLPAAVGDRWDYDADYGLTQVHHSGSIEAIESIQVPAGEFVCVKVRTIGKTDGAIVLEWTSWYAPGVGLVREEAKHDTGAGQDHYQIVLKSFKKA